MLIRTVRKHFYRILQILLAVIMLVSLGASYVLSIDSTLFAATEEEYNKANKELEELKKQQSALSSELSEISSQLEITGSKIAEIEVSINEKQTQINSLTEQIKQMEKEKNSQYNAMKLRIKFMYERDNTNVLEVLFTSKDFSELLVKSDYVQSISDYDRKMLENMSSLIANQKNAEETLVADMNELKTLQASLTTESDNLKKQMNILQTKIDGNSDSIAKVEAVAIQYEEQLERNKKAREAANAQTSVVSLENNSSTSVAVSTNVGAVSYDIGDLEILAAIIECEAGTVSYDGMIAVGSVVMNRVDDPRFANSISGVIYASGQFSPVASGRFAAVLSRGAADICYEAANDVLNGARNVSGFYFRSARVYPDLPGVNIGGNIFF